MWLHTTTNQLHVHVTTSLFGYSGTQIYDPLNQGWKPKLSLRFLVFGLGHDMALSLNWFIINILIFSEYDKPWWRLNAACILTYTQLLCNNKISLEHENKPSPGHLSGSAPQRPNLLYQRSPFPTMNLAGAPTTFPFASKPGFRTIIAIVVSD